MNGKTDKNIVHFLSKLSFYPELDSNDLITLNLLMQQCFCNKSLSIIKNETEIDLGKLIKNNSYLHSDPPVFDIKQFPEKIKIKKYFNVVIPLKNKATDIDFNLFLCADNKTIEKKICVLIANIISDKLTINYYKKNAHKNKALLDIGIISNDIFHELKNKLIAPSTFIQIMKNNHEDMKFRKDFSKIALQEIKSMENILFNFMKFGKKYQNEKKTSKSESIDESINYILSLLQPVIKRKNIQIIIKHIDKIILPIKSEILRDIIFNILLNSIDALEKTSIKTITIQSVIKNNFCFITFKDSGKGIEQKYLSKVFEPFYTSKKNGNGLGLSIVKKEVEKEKGLLSIESKINEWTEITIKLPQVTHD